MQRGDFKGGDGCYVKLFTKSGMNGIKHGEDWIRIGWDGQEWVGGMDEKEKGKWHTEPVKGFYRQKGDIESLEVVGHCKWQISW